MQKAYVMLLYLRLLENQNFMIGFLKRIDINVENFSPCVFVMTNAKTGTDQDGKTYWKGEAGS